MHEPYRNPIAYILRKPQQQQRSYSNSSCSNSNSKRMTYTYNNNHRKTTNNNNTVSQNYNISPPRRNSFMMKGTVLTIAILGSIILLNTILKHEILISLQDIISSSTTTTTTTTITRSTSIKMIPITIESNENTKSSFLRTSLSQTPKTTTTTDNTFRNRMISLPFIDQLYSYFDYDENDELLLDKDDDDNDDIIENIDTMVEDTKIEQIDNDADDTKNQNEFDDDDNELFEEAIRYNFNVSLYSNYHETISRSHRFPSVQERIKVYMSNWYLPPILPCNNNNDNIDNDPRIQYNYITQYDPQSNETKIIVLLRQSQHISVNFMNNNNNTFVLTIGNVPEHSRVPFVYNQTMILQHRTDRFVQDVVKYFIPSLQRIHYPNTTDISMYQMNIDTQSSSSSSSSSRVLIQPPPPPPIPILLQIGDAEQYRMYSPNINTDIYRPVIPIIKKFRYSMNQNELHRITTSDNSELELESKCIENMNDIGQQQQQPQPQRMARTIRIGEPMMSQYIDNIDNIPHHVQPIVSILSNYERHFNPLNDVVSADIPWNEKLNIAIYRGGLTGRNRKITIGTTSNDQHTENNENDEIIWCQQVPRCNLVLQHGTSKYVNAKLVSFPNENHYRVQPILNNVTMFGNSMTFQEMLQYKAIIMLEGNDVSTGLKWSLYSNSVVLMPKPTCTSWAMEELLQPYVHYIPLYDNLTNVEEQVQWMIDHDDKAQQIAHNGKLWMLDLAYHPQVAKDTEDILDETFERYMKHFIYNPNLQLE